MRKVLRSGATELNYHRTVQPQPKLGPWIETLTALLEGEAKLPRRERRSTQHLFEELRERSWRRDFILTGHEAPHLNPAFL